MPRPRILLAVLALSALGALVSGRARAAAPAAQPEVLPWIENDYPKAVALAKARKVPIFVECWAPW
jgi:hypothetical protein